MEMHKYRVCAGDELYDFLDKWTLSNPPLHTLIFNCLCRL